MKLQFIIIRFKYDQMLLKRAAAKSTSLSNAKITNKRPTADNEYNAKDLRLNIKDYNGVLRRVSTPLLNASFGPVYRTLLDPEIRTHLNDRLCTLDLKWLRVASRGKQSQRPKHAGIHWIL